MFLIILFKVFIPNRVRLYQTLFSVGLMMGAKNNRPLFFSSSGRFDLNISKHITGQRDGSFVAYIRGNISRCLKFSPPFRVLDGPSIYFKYFLLLSSISTLNSSICKL